MGQLYFLWTLLSLRNILAGSLLTLLNFLQAMTSPSMYVRFSMSESSSSSSNIMVLSWQNRCKISLMITCITYKIYHYLIFLRDLDHCEPVGLHVPGEGGHEQPLVPVVHQLRPLNLQLELVLSHLPDSGLESLVGLGPDYCLVSNAPVLVQFLSYTQRVTRLAFF